MSYRFLIASLIISISLGGCIIAPLHRQGHSVGCRLYSNSEDCVPGKGYPIRISTIPNREGVDLRNRLIEAFQDTQIYFPFPCKMAAKLSIQNRELVKYSDGSTGRCEIACTVNYSLISIRTGKELLKSKASSTVTYNTASSEGLFELMIYEPYYNSMFEQIAREVYEQVRLFVRDHKFNHED